jgi:hypothetical protein
MSTFLSMSAPHGGPDDGDIAMEPMKFAWAAGWDNAWIYIPVPESFPVLGSAAPEGLISFTRTELL